MMEIVVSRVSETLLAFDSYGRGRQGYCDGADFDVLPIANGYIA